jgi:hypothetical protein
VHYYTKTLTTTKDLGNTVKLGPKWARTLPSLIYFSWDLEISHEKDIKEGKILDHFGLKLMVLPGPLTDLRA